MSQIQSNAKELVGPDSKLVPGMLELWLNYIYAEIIDPKNLCTVMVSPRQRAHKTFHLLFEHTELPNHILTEEVREWDYGEYEGLVVSEIKQRNPTWSIWKDGCEW